MKHIKTFENINEKKFWSVRTDEPYLGASLLKLKLPEKQIEYLINNEYVTGKKRYYNSWNNKRIKINKIFIKDANVNIGDYSFWEPFENDIDSGLSEYQFHGYDYHGEVKVNEEDIKEWEIYKQAKSYNL